MTDHLLTFHRNLLPETTRSCNQNVNGILDAQKYKHLNDCDTETCHTCECHNQKFVNKHNKGVLQCREKHQK